MKRNRLIFILAVATLLSFNSWADNDEPLFYIFEGSSRKYGYIDKSGEVFIEPQFFEAKDFCEGLARVNEGWDRPKLSFI